MASAILAHRRDRASPENRLTVNQRMSFGKHVRANKALYLMLVPGILYYIIFHYAPMAGIVIAFKDFDIFRRHMAQ